MNKVVTMTTISHPQSIWQPNCHLLSTLVQGLKSILSLHIHVVEKHCTVYIREPPLGVIREQGEWP